VEETRHRSYTNDVRYRVLRRFSVFEPSRRPVARLRRRFRTAGARWRRNGSGAAHKNDPSGQQGLGHTRRVDTRQRDQHRQGGQRVANRRQFQLRPQRDGCSREYTYTQVHGNLDFYFKARNDDNLLCKGGY